MKSNFYKFICFLLAISVIQSHDDDFSSHQTEQEIDNEIDETIITYGSNLKIQNFLSKFYLYSNKYTWGTGSQLQIITGLRSKDDPNTLWVVKEKNNDINKNTGEPLKCNDIIRLEHSGTGKNLHSHSFRSWITDSQEACGFGDNGHGDDNDNFKLICYGTKDTTVYGKTQFFLQHVPTGAYLYINIKTSLYDERNCRNCPIMYQREVSLTHNKDKQCLWKVAGGLFFNERKEAFNNDEE